MKCLKFLMIVLVFGVSNTIIGQTYSDSDNVPGRGRGTTGVPLKYDEFFDQDKIPEIMGTKTVPIEIVLNSNVDESDRLEDKITEISNAGGGYLLVKTSGTDPIKLRNVRVSSNVHIMMEADVKFEYPDERGGSFFLVGDREKISNIAITCATALGNTTNRDDWFSVDVANLLDGTQGGTNSVGNRVNRNFCKLNHVENFKISGVIVQDFYTEINAINLSTRTELVNPGGTFNGEPDKRIIDSRGFGPSKGIISNIESNRGEGGYGLVQIQVGEDVLFYNLHTVDGGVTVRFESGSPAGNNVGYRMENGVVVPNEPINKITVDRVFVRKASSTRGSIALLMNPHRVIQGVVDVDDISATGSFAVVNLDGGFKDANGTDGIVAKRGPALDQFGTFDSNSIITNIKFASGGDQDAAYSRRALGYLDCSVFETEVGPLRGDGTQTFKSMGAVEDNARPEGDGIGECEEGSRGCYEVILPDASEVDIQGTNFALGDCGFVFFSRLISVSGVNKTTRVCTTRNTVAPELRDPCNTLSVEETQDDFKFVLYPNPTQSKVFLSEEKEWSLYSIMGTLIAEGRSSTIDLATASAGIYLVRIENTTYRIVKQ